ncbi:MAG: trypsin-like serine protease [Flavobacteriales bacterium]
MEASQCDDSVLGLGNPSSFYATDTSWKFQQILPEGERDYDDREFLSIEAAHDGWRIVRKSADIESRGGEKFVPEEFNFFEKKVFNESIYLGKEPRDWNQVSNMYGSPYRSVVHISSYFTSLNAPHVGSGLLISPYHVLTAAHVVSRSGADNIPVYIVVNQFRGDGSRQTITQTVQAAFVSDEYLGAVNSRNSDVAILVLKEPLVFFDDFHLASFKCLAQLDEVEFNLAGYPTGSIDQVPGSKNDCMMHDSGKFHATTDDNLRFDISVSRGQSGGPIYFINETGENICIGILASYDSGVRLVSCTFRPSTLTKCVQIVNNFYPK